MGLCLAACLIAVGLSAVGAGTAAVWVCEPYELAVLLLLPCLAASALWLLQRRNRRAAPRGCSSKPPIACDPGVFAPEERKAHFERARRVVSAIDDLDERPDGFRMSFPRDPALEKEVARWIEGERQCCPFLRFEVRRASSAELSVTITGPAGAKALVAAGLREHGVLAAGGTAAAKAR